MRFSGRCGWGLGIVLAVAGGCGDSEDGTSATMGSAETSSSTGQGSSTEAATSANTTASSGLPTGGPSTADGTGDSGSSTTGSVEPPDCGVLEGLPSEPGPHIAQIDALGDDEWVELGAPAADPEFGQARGRSWGGQALVLAPELGGAFFTGEGVHAYVKPDGYGMDDVFFYDFNAHAWIALHPGVNTATFNQQVSDGDLSIDENGQLQDQFGDPVPLHVLIHAWDFLTYDPMSRRFAFLAGDGMGRYYMPGLDDIDQGLTELEAQRAQVEVAPMSPWFYSTTDCRWERYPIENSAPNTINFGAFMYASATDQYLYADQAGVVEFDRDANAWVTVEDTGPRPTGIDYGAAYDPTRNRFYLGSGDGIAGAYIYDIGTSTWTQTSAGSAPSGFGTNFASVFYDSVNDVVTVLNYNAGVRYTYSADDDTWTNAPIPSAVLNSWSYNAFYAPALNAYFVYGATDSMDNGTMWAYRYAASN